MSLSFIASHFPTSPFMSIGFLVLCLPCSPLTPLFSFLSPLCPFQFPCVSLSFPLAFLSCHLPVPCMSLHSPLFPPLISLHFLAFPFAPRYFSEKKHCVSNVFAKRIFSAKGGRKPEPAKSRQGDSSLGPLFCNTHSGDPLLLLEIYVFLPGAKANGRLIFYFEPIRKRAQPNLSRAMVEEHRAVCWRDVLKLMYTPGLPEA